MNKILVVCQASIRRPGLVIPYSFRYGFYDEDDVGPVSNEDDGGKNTDL
jgi:hypothetical protein